MHLSTTGFFSFQKEGKDKKKNFPPQSEKSSAYCIWPKRGTSRIGIAHWPLCRHRQSRTPSPHDTRTREFLQPKKPREKKNHSKEEVPQSWQRWWSCNNNTTCFQDSDHSRQEMKNSSRIISLPKRFLFPTTLGQAEKKLYEQQNWERESCWDSFSGFSRAWNNAFAHIST